MKMKNRWQILMTFAFLIVGTSLLFGETVGGKEAGKYLPNATDEEIRPNDADTKNPVAPVQAKPAVIKPQSIAKPVVQEIDKKKGFWEKIANFFKKRAGFWSKLFGFLRDVFATIFGLGDDKPEPIEGKPEPGKPADDDKNPPVAKPKPGENKPGHEKPAEPQEPGKNDPPSSPKDDDQGKAKEEDAKLQAQVNEFVKNKLKAQIEILIKETSADDPMVEILKKLSSELETQSKSPVKTTDDLKKKQEKIKALMASGELQLQHSQLVIKMARDLRSVNSAYLLFNAKENQKVFSKGDFLKRFDAHFQTAIPVYEMKVEKSDDLAAKQKKWDQFMVEFHKLNDEGLLALNKKK